MAARPLTSEAIALTEKKMDMSLDDIIKMSKKNSSKVTIPHRASNKSQGFHKAVASQRNSKVPRYMDSRSSIRQGVLAQRRSKFQGNQFPLTTEVARKAVVVPIRNRGVIWNKPRVAARPVQRNAVENTFTGKANTATKQRSQTLDALFANMKQQRMRVMSQQVTRGGGLLNTQRRRAQQQQQQQQQQQRGRGGAAPNYAGHHNGNYVK